MSDSSGFKVKPERYTNADGEETIDKMVRLHGWHAVAVWCRVNVTKYEDRAGKKGDASLDLEKAEWMKQMARHLIYPDQYPDPRDGREK